MGNLKHPCSGSGAPWSLFVMVLMAFNLYIHLLCLHNTHRRGVPGSSTGEICHSSEHTPQKGKCLQDKSAEIPPQSHPHDQCHNSQEPNGVNRTPEQGRSPRDDERDQRGVSIHLWWLQVLEPLTRTTQNAWKARVQIQSVLSISKCLIIIATMTTFTN